MAGLREREGKKKRVGFRNGFPISSVGRFLMVLYVIIAKMVLIYVLRFEPSLRIISSCLPVKLLSVTSSAIEFHRVLTGDTYLGFFFFFFFIEPTSKTYY